MSRAEISSLRAQSLRLRLDIALWRYGWLAVVGPVLGLIAVVGWWLVVRPDGLALAQVNAQLAAPPAPITERAEPLRNDALRWQALQDTLRAAPAQDELVRRWTELAKTHQVRWRQTQFQTAFEPQTGTQRIKVVLPVTAAYPKLRAFTEALLRDSPNVSLDQMHFERRNTLLDQVETHISLSIWLPPAAEAGRSISRVSTAAAAASGAASSAVQSPDAASARSTAVTGATPASAGASLATTATADTPSVRVAGGRP